MNDREVLERNVRLAFEVAQTAIADESAAAELAEASKAGGLVFADPSDPELSLVNQQLADVLALVEVHAPEYAGDRTRHKRAGTRVAPHDAAGHICARPAALAALCV